jgi:hypothetical protein
MNNDTISAVLLRSKRAKTISITDEWRIVLAEIDNTRNDYEVVASVALGNGEGTSCLITLA